MMPIWFVYRSPYAGPMSKHVKRLDGADTLLGWFRSVWRAIADTKEAYRYAEELLGIEAYRFGSFFNCWADDHRHSPPETPDQLHEALRDALYFIGEYRGNDDTIQVL